MEATHDLLRLLVANLKTRRGGGEAKKEREEKRKEKKKEKKKRKRRKKKRKKERKEKEQALSAKMNK